ncbi:MAG: transposase, partial [Acidobacteria bacterium]|nr:transposase [Acidobacteriota bacterium]
MPAPRKYPNELRERSVRLVSRMRKEQPQESHRAISTVAQRLDVHPATLRLWVNQAEVDQGARAGTTTVEAARIAELERENRELRRAKEILKAASAFFARELDPRLSRWSISSTTTEKNGAGPSRSARCCGSLRPRTMRRRTGHRRPARCGMRTFSSRSAASGRRITTGRGRGRYGLSSVGKGVAVARCRLERLMRADRAARRRFTADRPIAWWVADITDVPAWSGMVSLAVVTDVFSRGVVGYGLDTSMRTDLPLDALDMAIRGCGGGPWEG